MKAHRLLFLFQCLTSKIDSSMDFKHKSESILEFWNSVSKLNSSVKNREHLLDEIKKCIRLVDIS